MNSLCSGIQQCLHLQLGVALTWFARFVDVDFLFPMSLSIESLKIWIFDSLPIRFRCDLLPDRTFLRLFLARISTLLTFRFVRFPDFCCSFLPHRLFFLLIYYLCMGYFLRSPSSKIGRKRYVVFIHRFVSPSWGYFDLARFPSLSNICLAIFYVFLAHLLPIYI